MFGSTHSFFLLFPCYVRPYSSNTEFKEKLYHTPNNPNPSPAAAGRGGGAITGANPAVLHPQPSKHRAFPVGRLSPTGLWGAQGLTGFCGSSQAPALLLCSALHTLNPPCSSWQEITGARGSPCASEQGCHHPPSLLELLLPGRTAGKSPSSAQPWASPRSCLFPWEGLRERMEPSPC